MRELTQAISPARPKVLMLGQYALEGLNSAPKVRTAALKQALERISDLTFITGWRDERRWPLLKLIAQEDLASFDCVYLEAATSTSMEVDLLLLSLLKRAGVPIGIYIRDAYQLFGLSPAQRLKDKILNTGWFVSQWWFRLVASSLFFPSQMLADHFDFPHRVVLMPAGEAGRLPEQLFEGPFRYVLFAGRLDEANGWEHLAPAMEILVRQHPQVRLLALTALELPEPLPPWLELRRGSLDSILPDLPQIACGVVPRPHSPYNDLAIPLKLMDYLSLGLPLVTTRCRELAQLVEHEDLGLTSEDSAESLGQNLCALFSQPELRQKLAQQVRAAFLAHHTWDHRARQILNALLPQQRRQWREACKLGSE